MTRLLLPMLLPAAMLSSAPAAAAPPSSHPSAKEPAESEEAAIDRIFLPTLQLEATLRGPLDRHEVTRNAFAVLGSERGCQAYRDAWGGAFRRHLRAWKQSFRTGIRLVVPPEALRTARGSLDPAVTNIYGQRIAAELKASEAMSIVRTMGSEILASLDEATKPASRASARSQPDARFALSFNCGASLKFLEESSSGLDP